MIRSPCRLLSFAGSISFALRVIGPISLKRPQLYKSQKLDDQRQIHLLSNQYAALDPLDQTLAL